MAAALNDKPNTKVGTLLQCNAGGRRLSAQDCRRGITCKQAGVSHRYKQLTGNRAKHQHELSRALNCSMSPPGDASHDGDGVSIARTVSARIHHSMTVLLRSLSPLPPGRPFMLEPRPKGILFLGYLRSRVYVETATHDSNESSTEAVATEPLHGRVFNTHSFLRVFLLHLVATDQTELKVCPVWELQRCHC